MNVITRIEKLEKDIKPANCQHPITQTDRITMPDGEILIGCHICGFYGPNGERVKAIWDE